MDMIDLSVPVVCDTEVLSILATEKVKSVERSHTIIEFVAISVSVRIVCTSLTSCGH